MTTAPADSRLAKGTWFWISGGFAGLLLAAIELAFHWPEGDSALTAVTVLHAVSLCVLFGLMLGAMAALAALVVATLSGSRKPAFRNPGVVLLSAVLLASIELLNESTFDGPAISSHPQILWILTAFHVAAVVGSLIMARILVNLMTWRVAGPAKRILAALIFSGVSASACWVDRTQLVGHYPAIHMQLTLSFLLSGLLAVGLFFPRPRGFVALALVVLAILGAPLRKTNAIHGARAWVESRTLQMRGISSYPETLVTLAVPLPRRESGADDTILLNLRRIDHKAIAATLNRDVPNRSAMNLLIVSLDTLRTDHVGAFGYTTRPTTPHFDALAARSIRFHNTYTAYPTSGPSYSSFFTGRFPSCAPVNWVWDDDEPQWPATLTLAGALRKRGYQTYAETAFNRETLARRDVFGHLRDGFEIINPDQTIEARMAPAITASAIGHLDSFGQERFLLWVHYLDIHEPYRTHEAYDFPLDSKGRYDSEIAWTDSHMGKLLAALEKRGLMENTIICVMSDHGEEFGEHNSRFHNTNLYEQQARVPVILHVPQMEGRDVKQVTSLTDMMPTLLELMDINDPHRRSGRSLWPEILGLSEGEGSFAFAEFFGQKSVLQGSKKMVVHGNHKLIFSERSKTEEIYDIRSDPLEEKNLVGQLGDREEELRGLLNAIEQDIQAIQQEAGTEDTATETPKEELRRRMAEIRSQPLAKRRVTLPLFIADIADGVFGIDHAYAAALNGELRDEALSFASECFDQRDPGIAISIIELIHIMKADSALPVLQGVTSLHPLIRSRAVSLRGLLGDKGALPELKALLAFEGVPAKHDVAIALMNIGDDTGLDLLRASLWNRSPLRSAEAVLALGKGAPDELLSLSDRCFTHEYWQYAPIRLAMVNALSPLPPGPLRDRLLARLGYDAESSVAGLAREALRNSHDTATVKSLLAAAEAEVDGDQAIEARRIGVAILSLRRAAKAWNAPHPSLLVKLASLEYLFGDRSDAEKTLEQLAAIEPELASRWAEGLKAHNGFLRVRPKVKVLSVEGDRRTLRNQWNATIVEIRNEGKDTWLPASKGLTIRFEVVLRDASGAVVPGRMEKSVELTGRPVRQGEKLQVCLPYMTPIQHGVYQVELSMDAIAADGGVRKLAHGIALGELRVVPQLR